MPAAPRTVRVDLGNHGYDIVIGENVLDEAGDHITALFPSSRICIVTDENVAGLHGARLTDVLGKGGSPAVQIAIAPGEKSKSFEALQEVVDRVLGYHLERDDVVVAFGGGVVGDLAGFVAGIVRRGMNFVQIPTSLLAQVDSSVGGKTGINTGQGKNLVGLFNQPSLVLIDTALLSTLSDREFRAGYAEVVKYGLIDRPDFFEWLDQNRDAILARDGNALRQAVAESCRAKAAVVRADEFEAGKRALLNLGHTFGHALEAAVGYDSNRLVHGEGVAIGMMLAHEFSARMNHCGPEPAERVRNHLAAMALPTSLSDIPGDLPDANVLMEKITQDKKVSRGALTFILTRGIGQSFIAKDVPASEVLAFLSEKLHQG